MSTFFIQLLKLAEKYDCVHAVKGYVSIWLREAMTETMDMEGDDDSQPRQVEYLAAALVTSYLIQDTKVFTDISRTLLLMASSLSFTHVPSLNGCEIIPSQLWSK